MADLKFPAAPNTPLDVSSERDLSSLGSVGPLSLGCWTITFKEEQRKSKESSKTCQKAKANMQKRRKKVYKKC
jgi:hypothetical protein